MTGIELVQEVARKYGIVNLSDDMANDILWEHTGYPAFFLGSNPEAWFRIQLDDFFKRVEDTSWMFEKADRPTVWERLSE